MSTNQVYINNTAVFFPNDPVSNEAMEEYLGFINNSPSRSKRITLRNNGIKTRYYALDKNGNHTHTNAALTAEAIKSVVGGEEYLKKIELLTCGTSSPDQIMPAHGVMVHGLLPGTNDIEVISPSGNCCSGMHALKYAYLSIKSGEKQNAVSTGSERASGLFTSKNYEEEAKKILDLEENPYIGFEKDFLRWMLSDGAGAFLMSNQKNEVGLSLRLDWLEGYSYANKTEACMYSGCEKMEDGSVKGYMEFTSSDVAQKSILSVKQDVKLLSEYIVSLGSVGLDEALKKHGVKSEDIDYFLPHMSSMFFKDKIYEGLKEKGIHFPYEKWFTNLAEVGNVGAASVYIMVHELLHSNKLKIGDKILLLVPESSRFSYMFGLLTVC